MKPCAFGGAEGNVVSGSLKGRSVYRREDEAESFFSCACRDDRTSSVLENEILYG